MGDAGRIVLAGDSAGGNLVVSTLLTIADVGLPIPAAGVLISPWVDLTDVGMTASWTTYENVDFLPRDLAEMFAECYKGPATGTTDHDSTNTKRNGAAAGVGVGDEVKSPLDLADLSPLYSKCLHLLPPMLVEFGACEVLHDQILAFCMKAAAVGVPIEYFAREDMVHAFPLLYFSGMQQCEDSFENIVQFLEKFYKCSS